MGRWRYLDNHMISPWAGDIVTDTKQSCDQQLRCFTQDPEKKLDLLKVFIYLHNIQVVGKYGYFTSKNESNYTSQHKWPFNHLPAIKTMKKWLILMVLPLLICQLSFFNVWYMDQWFHSNSNNINKVQIQCSSYQEYKS